MIDKRQKIIGEDRVLFEHIWKTGKGFISPFQSWRSCSLGALCLRNAIPNGTGRDRAIQADLLGRLYYRLRLFHRDQSCRDIHLSVLRVLKAECGGDQPAFGTHHVFILMFGVGSVLIDLGRPIGCSMPSVRPFHSPLLWDVCSITTYLTVSSISLYLALIRILRC